MNNLSDFIQYKKNGTFHLVKQNDDITLCGEKLDLTFVFTTKTNIEYVCMLCELKRWDNYD